MLWGSTTEKERSQAMPGDLAEQWRMTLVDLIKATVACGGVAFLAYSFPVLSQALIIGALSILWLSYAWKVVATAKSR